jgi:hypothetical protein
MSSDNIRRGGDGRDDRRVIANYRKIADRKWGGVGCLLLPSKKLTAKVSDHTLNLPCENPLIFFFLLL